LVPVLLPQATAPTIAAIASKRLKDMTGLRAVKEIKVRRLFDVITSVSER